MATVRDVYAAIDGWAPFSIQMDFDNAGLLVGREAREVRRILVALDITQEVAAEAAEWGAELIVSHHPVIFHPVKALTDGSAAGRVLLDLAEGRIAAICAHTNLDAAAGGVNDLLARALELRNIGQLCQEGVLEDGAPYGIGRVGETCFDGPVRSADFAAYVKGRLSAASVRFADAGRPVHRVAVGGGACGSMLADAAAAGCDTFVTADVKHDMFLEAGALGVNLMDAGHYATENVVTAPLADFLREKFPGVEVAVSAVHREPYQSV